MRKGRQPSKLLRCLLKVHKIRRMIRMTDEELKELEKIIGRAVETAINRLVAKGKRMPGTGGTGQVTEIIIRCGSSEGVQILSGIKSPCVPTCPPGALFFAALDDASKKLFEQIRAMTLDDAEGLARKLESLIASKYLAEAIRNLAESLGLKVPEGGAKASESGT